jgi:AraC family transcriptional regulator
LIEVIDFEAVPENMVTFELEEGMYLTFLHRGDIAQFAQNLQYLFQDWMPKNGYVLDYNRPHFEILGEKYKHGSPDSEEEIWIPIK